jgi:hypothetical protein
MKHLTPEELIDSLDRPLPPARQAHADDCARCRAERTRLATVVREVAAVDVPEPSPLFWDHLSARVRESVAQEPPPRVSPGWQRSPGWIGSLWTHWAMTSAVVAICVSVAWMGWSAIETRRGHTSTHDTHPGIAATNANATDTGAAAAVDPSDEDWAMMMSVAEEATWDDAESLSIEVRPATVERALNELSSDERRTLVQLLNAELARPPS